MKFLQWCVAAFARLIVIFLGLVRLPFALLHGVCEPVMEFLSDTMLKVQRSCPWPWIVEFRAKWETCSHQERERLFNRLDWSE